MHRLRKQKSKTSSKEDEGEGGILKGGKSFRRGKQPPVPPRPEIDLTSALPPTDDFRTSLLMPNLAQRFSILAVQEAAEGGEDAISSASKLFANSQFNSTNSSGLSDIAETRSLSGSIVGKYAQSSSEHGDLYGSDVPGYGSGMMSRPRPGEGNILFGGRQKVFRVPAGSTLRDSSEEGREGSPSPGMGGRAYYDDDVPLSTFQSLRKQRSREAENKEEEMLGEEEVKDDAEREEDTKERSNPTFIVENNRNTASSTNSMPTNLTRSSTAATSVTSRYPSSHPSSSPQNSSSPVFPAGFTVAGKQRRPLYEQALDQQLQEQQSLSKLEILASQRRLGAASPPPMRSYSPISSMAKETGENPQLQRNQFYDNQHNQPTPIGTPLNGLSKFNFGIVDLADTSNPAVARPTKASGYNDEQYHLMQQRKLMAESALERSRDPSLHLHSASVSSMESAPLVDKNDDASISDISVHSEEREDMNIADRKSEEGPHQPFLLTQRLGNSLDDNYVGTGPNSFEVVRDRSAIGLGLDQAFGDRIAPLRPVKKDSQPPSRGSSEGSNIPSAEDIETHKPSTEDCSTMLPDRRPLSPISPRLSEELNHKDDDSPTLPPQGLSVLVRQHLRTDSGRSSIYAATTYTTRSRVSARPPSPGFSRAGKLSGGSGTPRPSAASGSSGGNVWEFDELDGSFHEGENGQRPASSLSSIHPALREDSMNGPTSHGPNNNTKEAAVADKVEKERWDDEKDEELRSGYQSSDDDQGDRDWEDELALRKRLVQQNLKEHESRSNSPIRELAQGLPLRNNGAVGLLRGKGPNGPPYKVEDGNRPIKLLATGINGSDRKEDDRRFRRNDGLTMEEEERFRGAHRGGKKIPLPPHPHYPKEQQGPTMQSRPHFPNPNSLSPQNRLPPQLEDHPAMRPRQYPPGYPNAPPVSSRLPMRDPQLRSPPSREYMRSGTRSHDPRWREREDRNFDGLYGPPHRSPNPNLPHVNSHTGVPMTPRMSKPRLGSPPNGPPNGPPNAPPMPRERPEVQGLDRQSEDRYRNEPRMNGDLSRMPTKTDTRRVERDPSRSRSRFIGNAHEIGSPDGIGSPLGSPLFSPEGSPRTVLNRPRTNDNMIPARQRSESDLRRGLSQPPSSPPRIPPPPLPLNTQGLEKSPIVGRSPAQIINSPNPSSAGKLVQSPATPATPSSSTSAVPTSAHLAKLQNFQNASVTAAKKRYVDKALIGVPKLIASTSNIPTVALPAQSPSSSSSASSIASSKKRRQTTATIFGGLGKSSNDKMPAPQHRSDDEFGDQPKRDKPRGKLRKATSDGDGLSARARKDAMDIPTTPAIPQVNRIISQQITEGGMI